MSFLLRVDQDSLSSQKAFLNTTVAVYESRDKALMDFCTSEWIRIGKDHEKLSNEYNIVALSQDEIIEVTGCEDKLSHDVGELEDETSSGDVGRKLEASEKKLCDSIKIAKIPRNQDGYSMIKIEFN